MRQKALQPFGFTKPKNKMKSLIIFCFTFSLIVAIMGLCSCSKKTVFQGKYTGKCTGGKCKLMGSVVSPNDCI